ncbi:MAG: LysM peptidoglycan-binding domain-containing protein [Gammaproteobacteria bacterium]|nr:LysM peptidoglycan-binding domain-containing protein [Gammaproteobacteria bacterium]MBV9724902.1 LysM peptidoglycan-binding domain-containing protein [Gammaproteobacteria bacterium]
MVSNQVVGARALAGWLSMCIALYGCAHQHAAQSPPAAAPTATAEPAVSANPAPDPMTATEAAAPGAPGTESASSTASSTETATPVANATAPMHYTVKRGDTLWGIASMYLKDPWLWPEVWIINPQVPNPHLIYPGDKLALAYGAGGRVEVRLEEAGVSRLDPRLRSDPLASAIPTIPYSAIAAFLSRPTIMTSDEIRHAPYVLAFRDMHQVAGNEIEVYVRNLQGAENSRFAVMHIATPLVDPDDGKVVGYEGIYTATALVKRPGEPAKAVLTDLARETLAGDRLMSSDNEVPLNFTPAAPSSDVHGRIIDVVGGTDLVGQFYVVAINRGKRHGLVPGNVLAVDQEGEVVRDLYAGGRSIANNMNGFNTQFVPHVKLPNERAGTLLVFKTYDRISYGLIVGASNIIHIGAPVRNP